MDREEHLTRAYEFAHRTPKKLTAEQVKAIRGRASMCVSQRLIAKQLGVHHNTVNRIVNYGSRTNDL